MEALAAIGAAEWLVDAVVNSAVLQEIVFSAETLPAVFAGIRLLARVSFFMLEQVTLLGEAPTALLA